MTNKRLVSILLLGLLTSACVSASAIETSTSSPLPTVAVKPTATPIVYNVTVDVLNEVGEPITDAKITHDGSVDTTDANGRWQYVSASGELTISVWGQGYTLSNQVLELQPGENAIQVQLSIDPFGLQITDLEREGYELVFVEDFQDGVVDCAIEGNGNLALDDSDAGNLLLYSYLNTLEDGFGCRFGPSGISDAVIEFDFRYPDIRYSEFSGDEYSWQGYQVEFRDGFGVSGYPLLVSWGPTLQIYDYTDAENGLKFPVTVGQGIEENIWYTLGVAFEGNQVEVRMNDSLRFRYLNPPTMLSSNGATIGSFSGAEIEFDNIRMWIPVLPEE